MHARHVSEGKHQSGLDIQLFNHVIVQANSAFRYTSTTFLDGHGTARRICTLTMRVAPTRGGHIQRLSPYISTLVLAPVKKLIQDYVSCRSSGIETKPAQHCLQRHDHGICSHFRFRVSAYLLSSRLAMTTFFKVDNDTALHVA